MPAHPQLMVTLPGPEKAALAARIIHHPRVDAVRFNIGMRSPYPPRETLARFHRITQAAGKPLWIDLKGRQLRILSWADPSYGEILVNHPLSVDLPARIYFRGGGESTLVAVVGNRLFVDPDPPHALGAGQSVNIIGHGLAIAGYLTDQDRAFIQAAVELGLHDYLLSFVEGDADLAEVTALDPQARMALKIESRAGMAFVEGFSPQTYPRCRLVAARDDLFIELGEDPAAVLAAQARIIARDPQAMAASRLLMSLAHGGPALADLADWHLLRGQGFARFMLSDSISIRHFDAAMAAIAAYEKHFS